MFEDLTCFIPKFQNNEFGEWIIDRDNDGSLEHPKQFPFVAYNRVVSEFEHAVYDFLDEHKAMELNRYSDILEKVGINWSSESMKSADVSELDGRTVMALILGAIRAERFCDGALLDFFRNGCITKWLSRLQQIDDQV